MPKNDELNYVYEERAAIKEFCGNMTREEAERQAREELNGKEESAYEQCE